MTSILFIGKADDRNTQAAYVFCKDNFPEVDVYFTHWGDPMEEGIYWHKPDYLISYLSRWIMPESLLKSAKIAAINFHPAPPEYPGFAPNNFALYEGAKEFGVTCHHMAAKVDTGPIIAVKRFPIFPNDNIESLQARTYTYQLALFYEVMGGILRGEPLPVAEDRWKTPAYTKKQFLQLEKITTDMDEAEVERRIRATSFGQFQPFIELHGHRFELKK